ncbi:alpha-ribazole phosphatase family protein [Hymenobacter sp. BT664]|uniref:Alpha-ribazole phosphatase family protein n=1 Tax=Hymenobacter montanus TaxID=2771359 RepID=A0A927GJN3_9BACT|nr:alpha-ribazole phosphatase family protein [Hymenobacter montanus]MBD2768687.1 alpha-ribazole phosphatase family protein [Hymenobacter montanus]
MTVYLIRHTAVQATGICYGHHEVALADTFPTEAAQLRARLPGPPPGGYLTFSSPSARCLTLAAELAPTITPDERLREMHFGRWENQAWADLPPAETGPWMADYVNLAPPGGETFGAVQQRAATFLAELTALEPAEDAPVLVVTHGGTIRALVSHCLDIPLSNAFQLHIDFASITKLQWQHGRWNLLVLNG